MRPAIENSAEMIIHLQKLTEAVNETLADTEGAVAVDSVYFPDNELAVTYLDPTTLFDQDLIEEVISTLRQEYGVDNVRINIALGTYAYVSVLHHDN